MTHWQLCADCTDPFLSESETEVVCYFCWLQRREAERQAAIRLKRRFVEDARRLNAETIWKAKNDHP